MTSNKITIVHGARTILARLKSYGDIPAIVGDDSSFLYWCGHRLNGHVPADREGITWLRGWKHDQKTLDALVVASALTRM